MAGVRSRPIDMEMAGDSSVELTATAGAQEDRRLLQFALASFADALHSTAEAKRAAKRGDLRLNGREVSGRQAAARLSVDDVVTLRFDSAAAAAERLRAQVSLQLLYEDAQLAVVAKPAGVPSRSPLLHATATAERALPVYLTPADDTCALSSPVLLYCLESGTTGLLLAAKTPAAASALQAHAAGGTLLRRCRALAAGRLLHGGLQPGEETVLRGSVDGEARTARVYLVSETRSESVGWLSTVDVWLGDSNQEEKHTVRELLMQHGAPLLGHRGVGSFGTGSWIACVELRFPLEPTAEFADILATGQMVFGSPALATDNVGVIQTDTEAGASKPALPPTTSCSSNWTFAAASVPSAAPAVKDGWVSFSIAEPEKFDSCRLREAKRWEQAEAKRRAAHTEAAEGVVGSVVAADGSAALPAEYVSGYAEFYGLRFAVSPATMIPRRSSETLVQSMLARQHLPTTGARGLRILDLGTGCGCLLLSCLRLAESRECTGVGLDLSEAALELGRRNAHSLGLADCATFVQGDFGALASCDAVCDAAPFDVILCNPPYLSRNSFLDLAARIHEPAMALFAERKHSAYVSVRDALATCAANQRPVLSETGYLYLEVAAGQADSVAALMTLNDQPAHHGGADQCNSGLRLVEIVQDSRGTPRCVVLARDSG